jgi:hypothetical protein
VSEKVDNEDSDIEEDEVAVFQHRQNLLNQVIYPMVIIKQLTETRL